MTYTEEEFAEQVELAVRKVATPEGQKKFGQPIGTIITADMLKKANSSGSSGEDSSKGASSSASKGAKSSSSSSSASEKLSPAENYGSSNGVNLKESSISGPNTFKVGDSTFSAPAGSKLIRPKKQQNMAYVLTPDNKVHAFSASGEAEVPDYLEPILQEKFANLKTDDALYSVEEFDETQATSLKDQKQGAVLTVGGQPAFTKVAEDTWEHTELGINLTDDDLQPQYDAGKFDLQPSSATAETDFSKMTADEIAATLDSYEVGKELIYATGQEETYVSHLIKLESGNWKNVKFDNAGVSPEILANLVEGTPFLTEKVDVPEDAPETLQDPLSREGVGKTRDQLLTEAAELDLVSEEDILSAKPGTVVFHKSQGMIYKKENGLWDAESSNILFNDSEVASSTKYKSVSNLPWNEEQQDAYDQYQQDKVQPEEEDSPTVTDEDYPADEVTIPVNAKQVESLEDLIPGTEIFVDMDGSGVEKFTLDDDGYWVSQEGTPYENSDFDSDVDFENVWYVPSEKSTQSEEQAVDPYYEAASHVDHSSIELDPQAQIKSLDELSSLDPGTHLIDSDSDSVFVKGNGEDVYLEGVYPYKFKVENFSMEVGAGILYVTKPKDSAEREVTTDATPEPLADWEQELLNGPSATPSEEPDASSGLSDADKQSAVEALEAHSGFQIKYGLKSLPDSHPLKNADILQTEIDAAKAAYPDLPPKKALVAYLKGEMPLEPLADWEKDFLGDSAIQIGSENPKKVVQGVTGGSFTQAEVQEAINILENYPGKVFKSELVKKGNPLGALSPNDIIGFEKDKLVGKQKYIDFLKGKLEKAQKESAPKNIDEAIASDDLGLLDEPAETSLDDFEFSTATLEQVEGLPVGTKFTFTKNSTTGTQEWEKTGDNQWTVEIDGNDFHFKDADMLPTFNKDDGWSKQPLESKIPTEGELLDQLGEGKITYKKYKELMAEQTPSESADYANGDTIKSFDNFKNLPIGAQVVDSSGDIFTHVDEDTWEVPAVPGDPDGGVEVLNDIDFSGAISQGKVKFYVAETAEVEDRESDKPAFYPLDAGAPIGSMAEAKALPVGAVVWNPSEKDVWMEKIGEGKWEHSSGGTFGDGAVTKFMNSGNAYLKSLPENNEDYENGHVLISDPGAKKIGGQAGSNPGGLYELETPDGVKKFYVKKAQTEDHGKNEALANALYRELGVNAPKVDFASDGYIYSEIVDGEQNMQAQIDYKNKAWIEKVQKDFAIDAWLSNRDVFGMTYDNILTDGKGDPWRIDNGGALKYRAQGEKKTDFTGDAVPELDVFKTGKKSVIFGEGAMSKEQEADGAKRLAKLSPERIDELVAEYGMDAEMADILKGRREVILKKYIGDDFNPDTLEKGYVFKDIEELKSLNTGQMISTKDGTVSWEKNKVGKFVETSSGHSLPPAIFSNMISQGNLIYHENVAAPDNVPDDVPGEYVNGIAPGKYNTGKGAKAHLYVKSDGTGVYAGMKGVVKQLDAEGVKKNYDAGMNVFAEFVADENVPGGATATPSAKKKIIPTLGSVDDLPDGTYTGPLGVTYTVSGDEVTASKPVKSMDFSSVKVGQVPDSHFKQNAPVGTKLSFEMYKNSGEKHYVTKNADGDWEGDDVAENYLDAIDSYYSWKHKNWKVESFPVTDDKKVTKASLKSKFLQGQLIDPETKSSVIPMGYSGSVTFFDGPTDISALNSYRNYLKDDDVPIENKGNAHNMMGVPMDIAFIKSYVNKKHGVETSSGQEQLDYIVEELDAFLANANVPEPEDFSKVFQYDEQGGVIKPLEAATAVKPYYYDSTSDWTNHIKILAGSIGDGSIIGANMAGATKDQKEDWVADFNSGNFKGMYDLELQVAKKKGKPHPTGVAHPGHPDNKETHKISWGAAVPGEVPAGKEIPGEWTKVGVDASMAEINNYLILAKMQNPTFLTNAEKRSWVNFHKNGNKVSVDALSSSAALKAKNGDTPLSEPPVWTDNVVPAKSYDSLFDDTQFPQTWTQYGNHQKAEDFYMDNAEGDPELNSFVEAQKAEDPYGYPIPQGVQAYFAKKEEEYLEELNKPVWEVKKTISEGSHPTYIVKDQKSEKMKIFKPTTSGKEWRADNEVAAHNLGAMMGFNVPGAVIGEVNEGIPMGANNKGIVMDFAPNVGSLGNVDGAKVDLKTLDPSQFGQLAKEHVFDWFLDNDDTHDENLLIGTDGNLVAIDKGRAFVQYGHWHGLDVDNPESLNINTKDSPGRKSVVYADMIKAIKKGQISQEQLDEAYKQAIKSAKRIQKSDDNTIASFVRSATDQRDTWDIPSYAKDWDFLTPHPNNQDELVEAVLNRKSTMVEDFEEFYDKLYKAAGYSKPEPPQKALGEEHLSGWEESDVLTKTEEAKVWGAAPIHASAGFADGASLLWTEKDTNGNSVVSGKIKLGNITQQKVMDFMATKLSPNSGVAATSSLKDYPTAHVKQWKKTVTAAGKDVTANATSGNYDQDIWDTMKATEVKVDADLAHAQTVDVSDGGKATFPSGVTMPSETVPMYVMALNYHKGLIDNVEKAKAAKETTDKTHFQDFNPPSWKVKGMKYISPEGATYKELDDGNYVEVKDGVASVVPDVPDAAKSGAPGWTVEKPDNAVEESAEKYTLIQAGMFAGQLNENGEKLMKSDFNTSGHPGKEYRIDLPTGEKIFFRDGDKTGTVLSQTGTVRFQLNRLLDSEASLANVQSYLETVGVDTSGADEEQVESVYWRQMFGRIIGSNPQGASASVKKVRDKLLGMKSDLSVKVGKNLNDFDIPEAVGLTEQDERTFWHELAIEAWGAEKVNDFLAQGKHLPKYQHMDLNEPEKATGLPWFQRIDVELDALYAKGTMLAHGNGGKDKRHFDYIKSGAYTSTEERLRILGFYKTGASSSSDQGTGGANSVFTRVANGQALKNGAIYGSHVMYWSPEVMAMTGTYSYSHDSFGRLSDLQSGNNIDPLKSLEYAGGGNETMIPNNVSLLDFMELMVFDDEKERQKAIEEFKKKGIELLRGLPIEDRLVTRVNLDKALTKIKNSWKKS